MNKHDTYMGGCISLATSAFGSKPGMYDDEDTADTSIPPYYRYDIKSGTYKSKFTKRSGVSFRSKTTKYHTDTPYKKWCE
jgi:hypothetical protein